ncbi:hypothetical protein G5T42_09935 [Microbacterium sp. 4R-513]|uniref:hypothetical protein n=1 Tax=Microbacterium sp. 4R-513 TaxID=2567934 RepID=UPI0013E1A0C3|nr:hypothetical protein [Microbacterium sp. 4R-513]QIG39765.1 hypothetical protein G5T42_09935 [Microbacterium sp. 4R-513]
MASPERFASLSAGLADAVGRHADFAGIVLLGSASDEASDRRDEWSDHDFFAITREGRGRALRPDVSWLPDQDRLVLTAREGELGFVAVYDDGHVLEFAFSDASELAGALAGAATVAVDDEQGTVARLLAESRERAATADAFEPVNDARLVLVKLLIGVGRARRGEVLNAGDFVRGWAVRLLVRVIRGRQASQSTSARDTIDPMRRFERDFPEWAGRIAQASAQPVEEAARDLFGLVRELEDGWPEFPTRAADAVAARLGWA